MPGPVGILYTGHAVEVLRSMVDRSVQCVVTSPPYWGLRDYSICPCRVGRVQHDSSTLVGSQAGTPSEFSGPDPDCLKCAGTGRLSGMDHVWGGDPHCAHAWTEIRTPGMPGGPSPKQDSNADSRFSGSTCSTCSAWYGGLGMEPTPELFIEHLVQVFREVRRVLRDDGTLWVNIASSYASSGVRNGNDTFMLRNDLTVDEITYVMSELSHSINGSEIGSPDISIDIDETITALTSSEEV